MRIHLKRFRIRHKLLISSLAYSLPITILLYFVISGINYNIRFARLETQGLQVLAPLQDLIDLVSHHNHLANLYLGGRKEAKDQLNGTAAGIEDAFGRLDTITRESGSNLKLDPRNMKDAGLEDIAPAAISKRWQDLHGRIDALDSRESRVQHAIIVQNVQALITRVGDYSNLILDPDLDSYYLMDVCLMAVPQTQSRLAEIITFGQDALRRDDPSIGRALPVKDVMRCSLLAHIFEEFDTARIIQGLSTALREDQNFYGVNRSLQEKVPPALERYKQQAQSLMGILKKVEEGGSRDVTSEQFSDCCSRARDSLTDLRIVALKELDTLLGKRIDYYEDKRLTTLLISLSALALAAALVFVVSRGITKPLAEVMGIVAEITAGRLNEARNRLDGEMGLKLLDEGEMEGIKDETWQLSAAFVRMTHSLHSLIEQVRRAGVQVVTSATEISASAGQLEATAVQQASSILEVSATSKQIFAGSKELVDTMNRVAAVASDTAALAERGYDGLQGMDSTMRRLMDATASIASKLGAIRDKTNNIGSIVTTITRVADQTNLLSLNAAIEAEKAGEYGRGFSVVAKEIRALADQTAVATLDIEQMVKEMQSAVSSGVMEVDKFVQQVGHGGNAVENISGQLASIIEQVQALIPRFKAVTDAMEDNSTGAEEISRAMVRLGEGAEQTRDVVREFKTTAVHLTGLVQGLQNEVSRFKVDS